MLHILASSGWVMEKAESRDRISKRRTIFLDHKIACGELEIVSEAMVVYFLEIINILACLYD